MKNDMANMQKYQLKNKTADEHTLVRLIDEYKDIFILVTLNLITNLIILSKFITRERIYVFKGFGYDTYHQFIPEMHLIFNKLGGGLTLYSFQDGLGEDIIYLFRWLTDPFIAPIILVAKIIGRAEIIEEGIVLLPIFVSLFSGIIIYFYVSRYYNGIAVIIASYMYSLSGYLFSTGTHYWFTTFMVLFPLLLWAVDSFAYDNNEKRLIIVVFIIALHGPYGAFAMFIAAGLYYIYKSFFLCKGKLLYLGWLRFVKTFIVGIMMSSILFVPSIYEMIVISGRVSNESWILKILTSLKPISSSEIISEILRLFSNNMQGTIDNWHGTQAFFCSFPHYMSILFVLLIPQFIYIVIKYETSKKYYLGALIAILFATLTNFFSMMFNLYSYNQWRMMYVLLPFYALMSAMTISHIRKGHFSNVINVWVIILYSLFLYWCKDAGVIVEKRIFCICLFFILAIGGCLEAIVLSNSKLIGYGVLIIVLMFNLIVEHKYTLEYGATSLEYSQNDDYYSDDFLQECMEIIKNNEGDNFIRVDRTYLGKSSDFCWSDIVPARSVSMYNSVLDSGIKKYMANIVQSPNNTGMDISYAFAIGDYGDYFDDARMSYLGLKYVISNQKRLIPGWSELYSRDGFYLYVNTHMHAAGSLYTDFITESSYEQLDAVDKLCIEPQTVVLDEMVNDVPERSTINKSIATGAIDYKFIEPIDCVVSIDDRIDIDIIGDNPSIIVPINKNILNGYSRNIITMATNSNENVNIKMLADDKCTCVKETDNFNNGMIVEIIPYDCSYIQVSINSNKRLSIEKLNIYSITNEYSSDVKLENKEMGNIVRGSVNTPSSKILIVSIPFRNGWKAKLDGAEVEIFKANYGFMAIQIPSGYHDIEFEYHNPIIPIGALISFIGVLSYIINNLNRKKIIIGAFR